MTTRRKQRKENHETYHLRNILPRTKNQRQYIESITDNTVTICTGFAGTGKTLLALHEALSLILDAETPYRRIIVIRPYIPSNIGERMGFLPGKFNDKISPFVESIYDNLRKMLPEHEIPRLFTNKIIEFMILSMCRGRNFDDCVVIVEEAQNVPIKGQAIKMLLTRVGQNCRMIMAGDIDQCDIPPEESGLVEAIAILENLHDIGIITLDEPVDIQRSEFVRNVLERYHGATNNSCMRFL